MVRPLITKTPPNEKEVENAKLKMEAALDDLENIWLKDKNYLTGDKITIADLIALCEVDEPRKYYLFSFEPQIKKKFSLFSFLCIFQVLLGLSHQVIGQEWPLG